jgi:hypothetical protein
MASMYRLTERKDSVWLTFDLLLLSRKYQLY